MSWVSQDVRRQNETKRPDFSSAAFLVLHKTPSDGVGRFLVVARLLFSYSYLRKKSTVWRRCRFQILAPRWLTLILVSHKTPSEGVGRFRVVTPRWLTLVCWYQMIPDVCIRFQISAQLQFLFRTKLNLCVAQNTIRGCWQISGTLKPLVDSHWSADTRWFQMYKISDFSSAAVLVSHKTQSMCRTKHHLRALADSR